MNIKKILCVLAAMVTVGVCPALNASSGYIEVANQEYHRFIDGLTKLDDSYITKKLGSEKEHHYMDGCRVVHMYYTKMWYYYEAVSGSGIRYFFRYGFLDEMKTMPNRVTAEEINSFLEKNGFKARAKSFDATESYSFDMEWSDDIKDTLDASLALRDKFGLKSTELTIESLILFKERKGDVDGNGAVNINDALYLARQLASNGDIPLCADVNLDGKINVSDCFALAKKLAKL